MVVDGEDEEMDNLGRQRKTDLGQRITKSARGPIEGAPIVGRKRNVIDRPFRRLP